MDSPRLHHSREAEQHVLGAILLKGNEVLSEVQDILTTEDFHGHDHQVIFTEMTALDAQQKPIDMVTLKSSLSDGRQLHHAGGGDYLAVLYAQVPSTANVRAYAEIVKSRAIRRELYWQALKIIETSDTEGDVDEILSEAQAHILDVGKDDATTGPIHISKVIGPWLDSLDQRARSENKLAGISTGFKDLDRKTGGLEAGNLIVIAGRPGMGKTALAINIANNIRISHQKPCVVFSMEMSVTEIMTRLVSQNAHVATERLRTGDISDEHWKKIHPALQTISGIDNFLVDDSASISLSQIRSRARRIKQRSGLSLIIVDYLQLMTMGKANTRADQIAEVTRGLKALAKELKVPVLCLSQLNREVEKRQDRRPVLSDLKESGAIEQDADLIIFIYREAVYNPIARFPKVAEVNIGKQRNGPTGIVLMYFFEKYTQFAQMATDAQQEFWDAKHSANTSRKKIGFDG